jgi:hypothetical protein
LSGANGFTGYTGKFAKCNGPIDDILAIKTAFQERAGKKIGFSTIVAAMVTRHLIRNLTKQIATINIGIVGAFTNPRFCNNFGLIIVPIQIKVDLFDIVDQIDRCVSAYGASMMTASYLATNVYDLNILSNQIVDCVISYMPVVHPMKINGVDFNTKEIILPCVSMPVYTSVITTNGQYIINSTIITDDVDFQSFSTNPMI